MRISATSSASPLRPIRRIMGRSYSTQSTHEVEEDKEQPARTTQDISNLAHSMLTQTSHHPEAAAPEPQLKGRKFALLNNLAKALG